MYQYPDYLMHYGVPGMRWGVRRAKPVSTKSPKKRSTSSVNQKNKSTTKFNRSKYIKIGLAVVGVALAAYGVYKLSKYMNNKQTMDAGKRLVKQYNDAAVLREAAKDRAANAQKMADIYQKAGDAKRATLNANDFKLQTSGYRAMRSAYDKTDLYRNIR